MKSNRSFHLLALVLLSTLAIRAGAHTFALSYLTVVPESDHVHLELTLNAFELNFFSELDQNHNGQLELGEFAPQKQALTQRLADCLKLRVNDKTVPAETASLTPYAESHHLTLQAQFAVDARRLPVTIESTLGAVTSASHVTLVAFGSDKLTQSARLDLQSSAATFGLPEPAASPAISIPRTNTVAFITIVALLVVPGLAMVVGLGCVVNWHLRRVQSIHP